MGFNFFQVIIGMMDTKEYVIHIQVNYGDSVGGA